MTKLSIPKKKRKKKEKKKDFWEQKSWVMRGSTFLGGGKKFKVCSKDGLESNSFWKVPKSDGRKKRGQKKTKGGKTLLVKFGIKARKFSDWSPGRIKKMWVEERSSQNSGPGYKTKHWGIKESLEKERVGGGGGETQPAPRWEGREKKCSSKGGIQNTGRPGDWPGDVGGGVRWCP